MEKKNDIPSRRTMLTMEMSTFELPPSGDILVLAKRCALGPEGAKRMLDSVAPGQFEFVKVDDEIIDAIFCRNNLFLRAEKEALIRVVVEDCKSIMSPQCMIAVQCETIVSIKREL